MGVHPYLFYFPLCYGARGELCRAELREWILGPSHFPVPELGCTSMLSTQLGQFVTTPDTMHAAFARLQG